MLEGARGICVFHVCSIFALSTIALFFFFFQAVGHYLLVLYVFCFYQTMNLLLSCVS